MASLDAFGELGRCRIFHSCLPRANQRSTAQLELTGGIPTSRDFETSLMRSHLNEAQESHEVAEKNSEVEHTTTDSDREHEPHPYIIYNIFVQAFVHSELKSKI